MHSGQSHLSVGLPHSEIRGSQLGYQLLSAYRRFQRPSSPLDTKASIMCPCRLGHANLTPYPRPGWTRLGDLGMPRWLCMFQRSHARRTSLARGQQCHSRVCFSVSNLSEAACRTQSQPLRVGAAADCSRRTRDHRLHLSKSHLFRKGVDRG